MDQHPVHLSRISRYTIWRTGPGNLSVEVRPCGSAVIVPSLAIVAPGGTTLTDRCNEGNTVRFLLGAAQVERLVGSPTLERGPYLGLLCDAFLSIVHEDRTWGWSVRVSRDGTVMTGFRPGGTPVRTDREGFSRCALRRFPGNAGFARGHEILCLS